MMVYVAVINYKVEGYEEHIYTIVVGTFRMKDSAEKALSREYEFIESNINYTVTEMMISEQWIEWGRQRPFSFRPIIEHNFEKNQK